MKPWIVYIVFLGILVLWSLCGCTTDVRYMNLKKGSFDIDPPVSVTGIGKNLGRDTMAFSLSVSGNYGDNQRIASKRVWNREKSLTWRTVKEEGYYSDVETTLTMPESKADLSYRLKTYQFTVSFDFWKKWKYTVLHPSIFLNPWPLLSVSYGYNGSFCEFGAFSYLGFSRNKSTFEYNYLHFHQDYMDDWIEEGNGSIDKKNFVRIRAGLGGYSSVYWNGFALTYAPSIYQPWFTNSLSDMYTEFDFPLIINQYIGASAWLGNHWKLSMGVDVISGSKLIGKTITEEMTLSFWM